MATKPPIGWRDLERVLLEVFRDQQITVTFERGDSYITHRGVEYCIGDFAKEMEKRL